MAARSSPSRPRVMPSDSSMFVGILSDSLAVLSDDEDWIDESTYNLTMLIAAVEDPFSSKGDVTSGKWTPGAAGPAGSTKHFQDSNDGERLRNSRGLSNVARSVLPRIMFPAPDPHAALQEPWATTAKPPTGAKTAAAGGSSAPTSPKPSRPRSRPGSGRVAKNSAPSAGKDSMAWTYGRHVMTVHDLEHMPEMHLGNVKVNPPRAVANAQQVRHPAVSALPGNSQARAGFVRTSGPNSDCTAMEESDANLLRYVSQMSDDQSLGRGDEQKRLKYHASDPSSTTAVAPVRISGHLADKCRSISASIESLTTTSATVPSDPDRSETDSSGEAFKSSSTQQSYGFAASRMSIAIERRPPPAAMCSDITGIHGQDERSVSERKLLAPLAHVAQEHEIRKNTRSNRASAPKEVVLENWFHTFGSSSGGVVESGSGIEPHARRISMRSDPIDTMRLLEVERSRSTPFPMPAQTRKLSFNDDVLVTHILSPQMSTKIDCVEELGLPKADLLATQPRARSCNLSDKEPYASSVPRFGRAKKRGPLLLSRLIVGRAKPNAA